MCFIRSFGLDTRSNQKVRSIYPFFCPRFGGAGFDAKEAKSQGKREAPPLCRAYAQGESH